MKTSCCVSLFVCVLAGCSHKAALPPVPPAVRVEVVADASAAGGSAVYSAVAQPTSTVPLAFRGPGYVADVMNVRATDGRVRSLGQGDRVRRGDVLAHMRNTEYRDKLNQATGQVAAARAAAEKARLDFERAKRLWATQSVTKADMESATAQRDATAAQASAAEALLAEARIGLSDTALVAPIDGDVLKKNVEPGSYAGPGMPAFVLADVSRIKVVLGLPDVALGGIELGQEVAVTTDALPGQRFAAHISRIASAADPSTRNFDVEVEFANPKRLWRPGMIASVALASADRRAPMPRLPLTAFVDVPGKSDAFGVMVVEGTEAFGKAHLRPVELSDVAGNRVAVVRGLTAGDRVIVTGASIVAEGERVEIAPTEER